MYVQFNLGCRYVFMEERQIILPLFGTTPSSSAVKVCWVSEGSHIASMAAVIPCISVQLVIAIWLSGPP